MQKQTVPIYDIHIATYLALNGFPPQIIKQGSRVVFEFPVTQKTRAIMEKYFTNPEIPVLDFVQALRRLRAQMLSLR